MKKKYIKITLFTLLVLLTVGCTKNFQEINTDPDRSKTGPATNILAYTICYTSSSLFDAWNDLNEPSTYGGQIAKIQYIDEAKYKFRNTVVENKWHYIYITLNNCREIQRQGKESGGKNLVSVAKIWEAVLMQIATDTWRDCPYSEAARLEEGYLYPQYDKQEDIYPALLALLKQAADDLNEGGDNIGTGDILFNANITKWKKFCNSLRLRMAIRISVASPALAKSTVEEILGNPAKYPIITSNADNAFFKWPGSDPYYEPWMNDSRTRDDHGVSDVLVNLLTSLGDPRLPVYARPNKAGVYQGFIIGAKALVSDIGTLSRIGTRFRNDAKGFTPYFRAAETWFHIAEAAKLGYNTGGTTAVVAYNNGVKASLEENGVSAADATAYLAGAGAFDNTLTKIYTQEWIALFKQGMEVWSLYRRTGIPTTHYIAPGRAAKYAAHNTPPFRYPYPVNEGALNGVNLAKFKADVKDDFWGKQMWWDKRTGVN